jgi:hypothetical protein
MPGIFSLQTLQFLKQVTKSARKRQVSYAIHRPAVHVVTRVTQENGQCVYLRVSKFASVLKVQIFRGKICGTLL